MDNKMMLPHLNGLSPTKETTFKKLVEEVGECNDAVENLRKYEKTKEMFNLFNCSDGELSELRIQFKQKVEDVMGEIMDVAQVCATQLFVFEAENILVSEIIRTNYLEDIFYEDIGGIKYFYLDPQNITVEDIEDAMGKIISSMGKIAQLGKFQGESGELISINQDEAIEKYINQLFKIIGHSYSLLHILNDKYSINICKLFTEHVAKLEKKGYLKK